MEDKILNFNKYDFTADRIHRMINNDAPFYIPLYHGTTKDKLNPKFGVGGSENDYE